MKFLKTVGILALLLLIVGIGYWVKLIYIDGRIIAYGSADAAEVSVKAAEQNNPPLCSRLKSVPFYTFRSESDLINECFYRLAVYSHNKDICNNISDLSYKNACYREAISNTSPILCQKYQFSGENTEWLQCMNNLNKKN